MEKGVIAKTKKPKKVTKPANLVGPSVRKYRMEASLTQRELAAQCEEQGLKLTRGTLAKIECQRRPITACELFIIAKALKTPLANFYPPGFGDCRK